MTLICMSITADKLSKMQSSGTAMLINDMNDMKFDLNEIEDMEAQKRNEQTMHDGRVCHCSSSCPMVRASAIWESNVHTVQSSSAPL